MKNKKRILLIIPLAALIIIAILIAQSNTNTPPSTNDPNSFTKVDNYNIFFGIDNLVNDYLKNNNSGANDNYFYSNDIYQLKFKKNEYYLVVGDKVNYNYNTTKIEMISDVAYLINVRLQTDQFEVKEVDNYKDYLGNDLLSDDVKIRNDGSILKYNNNVISDTYIMNYYINYFKELLFVNYTKAYDMLSKKYKEKIGSLEDFNNYREELYNNINNLFINYSINGENGKRTYNIVLYNNLIIEFKETDIMKFNVNITNNE